MDSRILLLPLAALTVAQPAQALVYLEVPQAQALMFPGRQLGAVPLSLSAADVSAIERDSGAKLYPGSLLAWKCDDGWFFTDSVIGKHDLIRYAVALGNDGRVRQVEILEYREAYGGEVRNARWLAQFKGRVHGDTVKAGRDIQNISGATLSSEHVAEGIRRLLSTYALAIAGRY